MKRQRDRDMLCSVTVTSWNDRWLAFAKSIAVVLGLNTWMSIALLPATSTKILSTFPGVAVVSLPLVVLGYGIHRRSEAFLLWAYPTSLLLPIAHEPAIASLQIYGPVRLFVVSAGLLAYLFGSALLVSYEEPSVCHKSRPLRSSFSRVSRRWKRRYRIYGILSAFCLLCPLVLLYHVNFHETHLLGSSYPGRSASFTTLLNVAVATSWLVLFHTHLLRPLRLHRSADAQLRRTLGAMRIQATSGSPRPQFYLLGLVSLVLMALWFFWQTQPPAPTN